MSWRFHEWHTGPAGCPVQWQLRLHALVGRGPSHTVSIPSGVQGQPRQRGLGLSGHSAVVDDHWKSWQVHLPMWWRCMTHQLVPCANGWHCLQYTLCVVLGVFQNRMVIACTPSSLHTWLELCGNLKTDTNIWNQFDFSGTYIMLVSYSTCKHYKLKEGPRSDRNVWRSFSVSNLASVASLSVPTFVQTLYTCTKKTYHLMAAKECSAAMTPFHSLLCACSTWPTLFGSCRLYHSRFLFIVCVDTHR